MKAIIVVICCVIAVTAGASAKQQKVKSCKDPENESLLPWTWVNGTAGTIPYGCNFVYAGGRDRLLYVGRVRVGSSLKPAAIHHYGKGGSEVTQFIDKEGNVATQKQVEWLCSKGRVAWTRVADLSASSLLKAQALPWGYDIANRHLTYACIVHSFYNDKYTASIGSVVNGNCEFVANGVVVNSGDFEFWHTLEVLSAF